VVQEAAEEAAHSGARWFTLRYGALSGPFLRLLGLGRKVSGIAVGPKDVALQMGWGFGGRASLGSVTSARRLDDTVISRGVHGWRSDWLVNGAGDGLVEVLFDPAMRARVTGVPVRVRRLRVSVDDPDGVVAALRQGGRA
jgi:hypothetical protein